MPGGVVIPPPAAIRAAVQRAVPLFPIARFDRIAGYYNMQRQYEAQPSSEVRAVMDRIVKQTITLRLGIDTLSEEAMDALFDGSHKIGVDAAAFSGMLTLLANAAKQAAMGVEITKGAPEGALAQLISSLAHALEECGLTPDAKPRGDLVFLTESVLESYGQSKERALKAVQRFLDRKASEQG